MLALTALLLTLSASTAGGVHPSTRDESADLCTLDEGLCQLTFDGVPAGLESGDYATPAEVDCRAAVATVAVNSRADLQLESGDCSPLPSDYRFRVSRLPDANAQLPAAAPQRARRNGRSAAAVTSACRGIPERLPPSLVPAGAQPLALVSTPGLFPPVATGFASGARALREGRGGEPPDEPPRSGR